MTNRDIKRRVNEHLSDLEIADLTRTLDKFIECEATSRKSREFKLIRATMAKRLSDRIGQDVFLALYDQSVLEVD